MTNNLKDLKKELKSFAKRVKDFKYTDSALITFLLTGMIGIGEVSTNLFSKENEIEAQTKAINTSIFDLKKDFKRARQENDKLLRNTNLELIQLMEQGDHVTKSPWSSWQYGANSFYNDWQGRYKGRGDKVKDVKYTRSTGMDKYQYKKRGQVTYGGSTEISFPIEPNAAIPIAASLKPIPPTTRNVNLALKVDLSGLPAFEPATVMPPVTPLIKAPEPQLSINVSVSGPSRGSSQYDFAFNDGYAWGSGIVENVALNGGKVKIKRTGTTQYDYSVSNVKVENIRGVAATSTVPSFAYGTTITSYTSNANHSDNNAFFQVRGGENAPYGITINGSNIEYEVTSGYADLNELVHQDVHGGSSSADVIDAINKATTAGVTNLDSNVVNDIVNTVVYEVSKSQPDQYNVFANGGTIDITGPKAMLVNSYNHGGGNGVVINGGTVNLSGTDDNRAVFLLTPHADNTDEPIQYYYNTGDINVNSKNSSIFSFLPETKRNVAIINKGHMNLNNEGTAGIIIDKSVVGPGRYHLHGHSDGNTAVNLHLNFSKAKSDTVAQVLLSSTGYKSDDMPSSTNDSLFINKLDGNGIVDKLTAKNNSFPLVITGKKSVGLYTKYDTSTGTNNDTNAKTFINGQFAVDIKTNASKAEDGSAGIYSASNIDLQGHYIKVEGSNNVGVYPVKTLEASNSPIYFLGKGSIELTGGNNNTGIVIKHTSNSGVNPASGQVYSASEMVLNGGKENMAIYAEGHGGNTNDVVVKSIETGTDTQDNIFVFADNGAKVRVGLKTGGATPTVDGGLKVKANLSTNPIYNATTGTLSANVGGVYAKGANTGVDVSLTKATTDYNIDITGAAATNNPSVYAGFGIFANNSRVNAEYNKVKATDTGVAVAATDAAGYIKLDHGEVNYKGSGYALYTKDGGKIDLKNGKLTLDGKATGYINQWGANAVDLTGTDIDVKSDDVILMDLRGISSLDSLNLDNKFRGAGGFLSGANITPGSNAFKYKYAVIDGITFNVNSDLDKGDATSTSDGYIYARRLLLQNSEINVNAGKNVTANLSSADLTSIGGPQIPVGLAIAASSKSKTTNKTAINNDGNVTVNRTDSGNGGVGLYVNYGHINNNASGKVEVETTKNNPHAVGIYGTNSTPIVNAGKVTVGGDKSFGILGLSYRINNAGVRVDPTTEAYYDPALAAAPNNKYGKIDITNASGGEITMNKDTAVGIYAYNNSLGIGNNNERGAGDVKATNAAGGTITMNGGNNSIAMGTSRGTLTNAGTINVNGTVSAGMYATDKSSMENTSTGVINVAATKVGSESIGMFTQDIDTPITTSGTINVGKNSYGIYGRNVNMNGGTISVDDNGLGIYSTGPNVALNSGTINVANNNAVGVYVQDDKASPTPINITGNVNMNVGSNQSFGYSLITTKPVNLTTGAGTTATVGDKSVYIYSASPIQAGSLITNNSTVTTTGNNGYAIYSLQDAVNNGTLNLGSGVGNIGLYSTGGTITNTGAINVGPSNTMTKEFGIGMATGYYNDTTTPPSISNEGTIVNKGVINVTTPNSIGMYAVGSGSKAINETTGLINLSGPNTIGMYIDQGATGINYGTIKTVATGAKMKGVVLANGGILKNYGNIEITGPDTMGVYSDGTGVVTMPYAEDTDSTRGVTGHNNSDKAVYIASATDEKPEGSVIIKTPPKANPQSVMVRKPDGTLESVAIENVDTNKATPDATVVEVRAGDSTLLNDPFKTFDLNTFSQKGQTGEITSLAMYIDTSGINFTHPIQGLHYLSGLTDINLIVGTEATQYSNAKAIEIGDNILKPYNDTLTGITGTLNVNSSSLTWLAQPVRNAAGNAIDRVYLVKVPYTDFASEKDPDTKNFLDGLEQRYGVDDYGDRGERERIVFNKLNDIGKGETHIFAQAVNEMKGYQYSNTQQRINETGSLLDKEFTYLHDQWRNPSKQNNKIKVFGMRNEYNTDTAGVIDNVSNSYGVAYVHEDEAVTMGNSQGWYAGAVNNYYKFKDLGGSRENQTMIKAGIFKTMSPVGDHNGNLRWTIAGDVFAGKNEMKRRFWVVDDTFSAKSDYYSYGAALKTDIGYDIRTSERTHIRPYGALKLEYGRFTDIKEKDGEIRLKVDGNDYVSVKPEAGVEFKYVQPLAVRTNLSVGLTAAYTNELGKINELNKAKVRYTTADWYNLKNEKEDRRGSGKFDLNVGVDNTRFGVTANLGYDTKGENIRGGLGFRLIY